MEASAASHRRETVVPDRYTVAHFGRTGDRARYGAATDAPEHVVHGGHRLLRTTYRREGDTGDLFVVNAFDARLRAAVRFDGVATAPRLEKGRFDLDPGGAFAWRPTGTVPAYDPAGRQADVELTLEPYEARIFRLTYR